MLMGRILYPMRKSAGQMPDILGSNGTLFKSLHKEFRQKPKSNIVNPVSLDKLLKALCHSFFYTFYVRFYNVASLSS